MKTKEELIKSIREKRNCVLTKQKKEWEEFESTIDFERIYADIESKIANQYVNDGRTDITFNPKGYFPRFHFEYNDVKHVHSEITLNIAKYLKSKGFLVKHYGDNILYIS